VLEVCQRGGEAGSVTARAGAVRFLRDMCGLARGGTVTVHARDSLYSYLLGEAPLFDALAAALADDSLSARDRLAAAEVPCFFFAFLLLRLGVPSFCDVVGYAIF